MSDFFREPPFGVSPPPEPPEPAGGAGWIPPQVVSVPVKPRRDPPWGVLALLGFCIFSFVVYALVSIFAVAVYAFQHGIHDMAALEKAVSRNAFVLIPVQAAFYVFVLGFLYWNVRGYHGAAFWNAIRWNGAHAGQAKFSRFVCLAVGLVSALVVQVVSGLAAPKKKLPIDELFSTSEALYLLTAFGILVAPFVEEVFFRGYLYPVLARAGGTTVGILMTGIFFALIHLQQLWGGWVQLLFILFVGWMLTYVRARSGSVLASYLVHLTYNSTLFLMMWFATDFYRKIPIK